MGAILDLPCPSFILLFRHSVIQSFHNLSNENFRHTFLKNYEAYKIETWYTRGQWENVSCIPESCCCCLFIFYFFSFLSLQFSNIKMFRHTLSVTMRPRRLKHGTHVDSGQMYRVYRNLLMLLLISLFFLSNFQTLTFFVTLFSGTMMPRRLKLGTHVDSGQMYHVYRNLAAAAYPSLYSFFLLSNFQLLKLFVTLFSRTVRPGRLKLCTHVDSGWLYRVYRNRAAAAYPSLWFFIFLSLQFSNIKTFRHIFLRNCEA